MPVPTEIRLNRAERALRVVFGAQSYVLPAEYLRVESPSAEVQGHGPGERKTVGGKRDVAITGIEPIGNYAIQILFDDGHDTGLFSWAFLDQLGREQVARWADYLARLDREGLKREK